MKEKEFKVGDWVACDFKVQQVKEIKDGHVGEVSDGTFSHFGLDLDYMCFPLTLETKNVSDNVRHWSDQLHKEGQPGLNYPDIHNELVSLWVKACEALPNTDKTKKALDDVRTFARSILDRCREIDRESVSGVRLFRHRIT